MKETEPDRRLPPLTVREVWMLIRWLIAAWISPELAERAKCGERFVELLAAEAQKNPRLVIPEPKQ